MKYIQKFESFSKDGIDVDSQSTPEFNAVNNLKAKDYVELVFSKGANDEVEQMCKEVGINMPKTDEELDKAKEESIQYFINNPERIKDNLEKPIKRYPVGSGDGVVRTNRVGGVMESENTHKMKLTPEEMKLFETETPLLKLISDSKIKLYNNEVWFNIDDIETRNILNIFFDVDIDLNESTLSTMLSLALGINGIIQLVKLLRIILSDYKQNSKIKDVTSKLKQLSMSLVSMEGGKWKPAVKVIDAGNRYYIKCDKDMCEGLPDITILKDAKRISIPELGLSSFFGIKLSDNQYQQIVDILDKRIK